MSGSRWLAKACVAPVAAILGLIGAGLMWSAFLNPASSIRVPSGSSPGDAVSPSDPGRQRPSAERQERISAEPRKGGVDDLITGPVLPESEPVGVSIPRLGIRSRLVDLGIDGAGAMDVPRDPALAGWYTLGPAPGALGPAVIAGHVTWNQAPAVFFRLGALRNGDIVTVAREDGKKAVFSVTRVARFPKTRFPTRDVFGKVDHAGLRLITCGGAYDNVSHRYLDNVVVFAKLGAVR